MKNIPEWVKWTVGIVIQIIAFAFVAGMTYSVMISDIKELKNEIKEIKKTSAEVRLSVMENEMKHTTEAVQRIERAINRLLEYE